MKTSPSAQQKEKMSVYPLEIGMHYLTSLDGVFRLICLIWTLVHQLEPIRSSQRRTKISSMNSLVALPTIHHKLLTLNRPRRHLRPRIRPPLTISSVSSAQRPPLPLSLLLLRLLLHRLLLLYLSPRHQSIVCFHLRVQFQPRCRSHQHRPLRRSCSHILFTTEMSSLSH